jgi:hypothetical protein
MSEPRKLNSHATSSNIFTTTPLAFFSFSVSRNSATLSFAATPTLRGTISGRAHRILNNFILTGILEIQRERLILGALGSGGSPDLVYEVRIEGDELGALWGERLLKRFRIDYNALMSASMERAEGRSLGSRAEISVGSTPMREFLSRCCKLGLSSQMTAARARHGQQTLLRYSCHVGTSECRTHKSDRKHNGMESPRRAWKPLLHKRPIPARRHK